MKKISKKKKFFNNFFLLFFSVIISFIILECFLIIKNKFIINYDNEMWKYSKLLKTKSENNLINHVHAKNTNAQLQNVNININSIGIRGQEKDLSEWYGSKKKILFIGSSITFGWGVEEKKTLTSILENKLNSDTGGMWKVLNGGIGNYNTQRYVVNYKENLKQLKPDIIVIQYFLNDSEVLPNSYGNILTRNFHLSALLWKYINIKKDSSKFNNVYDYYDYFYQDDIFNNTEKYLKIMSDECRNYKIRCIVAYTPDIQFLNNSKFDKFEKKIELTTKKLGFEYLSLTTELKKTKEPLKNNYNDNHPNYIAHEIMSTTIYNYLSN
jgi:hypothetical protein